MESGARTPCHVRAGIRNVFSSSPSRCGPLRQIKIFLEGHRPLRELADVNVGLQLLAPLLGGPISCTILCTPRAVCLGVDASG